MSIDLWPHQKRTVEFAASRPIVFDASSAGTGKTPAWLTVMKNRLDAGEIDRCVVIAPKSLMFDAWIHQPAEFYPELSISVAEAPDKVREAAFRADTQLVIINSDATTWLEARGKRWFNKVVGRKGMMLIDESSWFKNPTSQRTRAAREIAPWFKMRTCMSGTPAPNTVTELWAQVHLLDQGKRLGRSFIASTA